MRIRLLAISFVLMFLSVARAAENKPTVAILYFDYSGKDEQMAPLRKGLAQMLISDLSSLETIRIVERDRLEEILAELKLGQSGKIDPASAAKMGKLLGARFMVLGGYFDVMGSLRADARLVEVETGRVVQSVGATGKPDDFLSVEQKLAQDLGHALITHVTPAQKAESVPPPKVKPPAKLRTKTAVQYSLALAAIDKKDKAAAKTHLQAVVKEQPDFKLASLDLEKMMQ
jgi:TolB-like protein